MTGTDERPGRGLWVGLAVGAPVIAYGVVGLVTHPSFSRAIGVGGWAGGLLVLHDAVLVPLVLAAVWAVGRFVPRAFRAPACFALLGTALAVALGGPGLWRLGNPTGNPTVHPFDEGAALAWVVAATWGTAVVWAVLSAMRERPSATPD